MFNHPEKFRSNHSPQLFGLEDLSSRKFPIEGFVWIWGFFIQRISDRNPYLSEFFFMQTIYDRRLRAIIWVFGWIIKRIFEQSLLFRSIVSIWVLSWRVFPVEAFQRIIYIWHFIIKRNSDRSLCVCCFNVTFYLLVKFQSKPSGQMKNLGFPNREFRIEAFGSCVRICGFSVV